MPELPEVETVRLGLEQTTLGQTITDVEVLLPRTLASPNCLDQFRAGLQGQMILAWQRRGKYLLAQLGQGAGPTVAWLGVHLRMTGQLLWVAPSLPLQKHTRVRFFFKGDKELRFVDQRTFGQIWWVPPGQTLTGVITGLQNLGPEPFSPEFSANYLYRQLQRSQRPIKNALLDQVLVAGLGNIYADESLFLGKISPLQRCCDLEPEVVERLHRAVIDVLASSLEAGGTSFSTFLDVKGVNGNYGGEAWVYNRTGQPCRVCGQVIQRLKLGGRSTHFCRSCQPEPG